MGTRVERRTPRIELQLPVELSVAGAQQVGRDSIHGQTLNVGSGGLAIASRIALGVGMPVVCRLSIGGLPTAFEGTVAWSERAHPIDSDLAHNLGIEFECIDEQRRRALRNLIAAAQLGDEPVTLRFAGLEQHVRAQVSTQPHGIRLSAELAVLADGNRVAFAFERPDMQFEGLVRGVVLDTHGPVPMLHVDLAVDDDTGARSRKHAHYGWEDEASESRLRSATLPLQFQIEGRPSEPASPTGAFPRTSQAPDMARLAMPDEPGAPVCSEGQESLRTAPALSAPSLAPRDRRTTHRPARRSWQTVGLGALTLLSGGALSLVVPADESATSAPAAEVSEAHPAGSPMASDTTPAHDTPPLAANPAEAIAPSAPIVANTPQNGAQDSAEPASSDSAPVASAEPLQQTSLTVEAAANTLSIWVPMSGSLEGLKSYIWRQPRAIAIQLPHGHIDLPAGRHLVKTLGVTHIKVGKSGARTALQVPFTGSIRSHEVSRFNGGLEVQIRFDKW